MPLVVGILRIQVGAVSLLAVMPRLGARRGRLVELWRRPLIVVAAIAAAAYQPLFFGAVSQVGVALGTLVAVGSGPVIAGLIGWVVLHHRPTRGWLAATAVAILGLVLRSSGHLDGGPPVGLMLALGAGVASATYTVAAKHQLDGRGDERGGPGRQFRPGWAAAGAAPGGPADGVARTGPRWPSPTSC